MKKLLKLSCLAIVTALLFASCEGPEGPMGQDASAECMTCHNSGTEFSAKVIQFEESAHSIGTYYTRGGECAGCHSTEGYLARKDFTSASDIFTMSVDGDQTPIGCRTCHAVHMEYDETDWALTFADQVTATIFGSKDGSTYDAVSFPDVGNANMCLQCHQARDRGNVPTATETADVTVSSHWGPHYGVQGNVLYASGGVAVSGAESYPAATAGHAGLEKACISCHMVDGDHTLAVNYDACVSCHGSADNAEDMVETLHTEIDGLKHELAVALVDAGVMNALTESEWVWNGTEHEEVIDTVGFEPVGGYSGQAIDADLAKAVYNYMVVYQDHSYGTHNPSYIRALLNNSIDLISAK